MFSKKISFSIIIGVMATVSGCQSVPYQGKARDVKRKSQESGVIALPAEPRDEDRKKAEEKMRQNCGSFDFRILEEGEVVVGQKTDTDESKTQRDRTKREEGSLFGIPIMSGDPGGEDAKKSSTTTALKEWNLTYECVKRKK